MRAARKPAPTNVAIARMLREMAACYAMDGIRFKPQAYERAAESLELSSRQAGDIFAEGGTKALRDIGGFGEAIADHVGHVLTKGTFPEYRACKKRYPIDVLGITAVDEIGPKRARILYEKLRVKTVADLARVATAGKLDGLTGFGGKVAAKVRAALDRTVSTGRKPLKEVLPLATRIVKELRALPDVRHAEVAGSVRRRKETVGDLDILVTTSAPEAVMAAFTGFPDVTEVIEHGPTLTAVRLANGMRADVRVIPDDSYGAALQYFTGDKNHNVKVRKIAIAKGLKLNEYGLWRGKKRLAAATEEDVYRALGMTVMPPEQRLDEGEIEAAQEAFQKANRKK